VAPHHGGRFGAAANDRCRANRGEDVRQPPALFGVAEKGGGSDAGLKNHDAELARGQFVDECRSFVPARNFAHRRGHNRRAAHAADELGQLCAQARLQKADAGTM
jgi:hypothetical protein